MIDSQGSTPTLPFVSPQLHTRIGRFQIVRSLGQGAQSVVYLAFDPQLCREVAVKVFRGEAEKADVLLNEARAVSRLSHASIVPVFEAAHDAQDGVAYLVFEYVAGPTLSEVLRQQGALEPPLAVKMLLPVLDAVAYAHANGVIHRDLKPSNILMDRRGMARVMDFGIAVRHDAVGEVPLSDGEEDSMQAAPVGTPAYMAPEYVQYGRILPQMDVFSSGLVLFEMLTGQRAARGEAGLEAMHFLVNNDVTLPDTLPYPVDERLRAVLSRALARDPALRYVRMADFAQALRDWLEPQPELLDGPDTTQSFGGGRLGAVVNATAQAAALEGLLRRIRLKSELPALPESMVQITRLASSDQQNLGMLTAAVLRDTAVTLKLLRTVNSTVYRSFGGGAVSTVSRAVQVLGYGAVRTAATSLPLLDLHTNQAHTGRLLDDIALAHFCGTVAAELSGLRDRDAEEAFICGSVHRLGRMLVNCYFADEAAEIERQVHLAGDNVDQSTDRTERQVLGLSYEALGRGVAKHWGLPDTLQHSMRSVAEPAADGVAAGPLHLVAAPATHRETLRVLSAFAAELTSAWMRDTPDRRQTTTALASQRYAKALTLTSKEIKAAIDVAEAAVKNQLTPLRQALGHSAVARRLGWLAPVAAASARALQATPTSLRVERTGANPASEGASQHCRDVLAAAIQDLADRLLKQYKLNDLVLATLSALQRAALFRQVIFCLRDATSNTMVGRIAVGASLSGDKEPGRLRIPLDSAASLLAAAVKKGEDLWTPDGAPPVPGQPFLDSFRRVMSVGSILLLPLHLKGQQLGLIYAERGVAAGPPLGATELALMATLRNQVLLAFRQRTF